MAFLWDVGMEGEGRHSLIQTGMTVVTGDLKPKGTITTGTGRRSLDA